MTKERQITLAKVLLSFSLVLILLGVALNLESQALVSPITNTHVIGQAENSDINITTTDKPVTVTEEEQETTAPENSNTETNNTNSGTQNTNTNTNTKTPTQPSQTPQAPTPSIEEVNNNLRKSIETSYGITVRYGVETNGYTVAGLSTVRLTDSNRINQLLNELNNNLSLYPSGFLMKQNKPGIP